MERGMITIDPYISHGLMGQEIRLNQEAAERLMRSAGIHRNIFVDIRSTREKRAIENLGETLAFKKFIVPNIGFRQKPLYDVVKYPDHFKINIDDQELGQNADGALIKRGKLPETDFDAHSFLKEQIVKGLNTQVSNGLKDILREEEFNLRDNWRGYLPYVGTYLIVSLQDHNYFLNHPIEANLVSAAASAVLCMTIAIANRVNETKAGYVPVDKFVTGYWQILRNHSKFILQRE